MSKRPVRRTVEKIDPMFYIPDGVDELVHDEETSENLQYAEGLSESVENIIEAEDGEDEIPSPKILGIISQTVRELKSGDERVDVILQVEDIEGVEKYEFRVSKR